MAESLRPVCRGEGRGAEIPEADGGGDLMEIAAMLYVDMDDDVENYMDPAKLQIEEGVVAEVMRRLEEEINRPCTGGGGCEVAAWFGGDHHQCRLVELMLPSSSSSSSSSSSFPAPAFFTVMGNEESCGPSFSHSASTVMANIDTRGVLPRRPIRDETEDSIWPWPWRFPEPSAVADPAAASGEEGCGGGGSSAGEGFAVEDVDDEWLARVLNGDGWLAPEAERGVSGDLSRPPIGSR